MTEQELFDNIYNGLYGVVVHYNMMLGYQPLPDARLGQYDPSRGSIIIDQRRSDPDAIDSLMVLAHELCHVVLHPPGSGSAPADLADHEPEDRIVHTAARLVCNAYGVTDYLEVMTAKRVLFCPTDEQLSEAERVSALALAEKLLGLMRQHKWVYPWTRLIEGPSL